MKSIVTRSVNVSEYALKVHVLMVTLNQRVPGSSPGHFNPNQRRKLNPAHFPTNRRINGCLNRRDHKRGNLNITISFAPSIGGGIACACR